MQRITKQAEKKNPRADIITGLILNSTYGERADGQQRSAGSYAGAGWLLSHPRGAVSAK